MEAVFSSEILVSVYNITQCHNPENPNLNSSRVCGKSRRKIALPTDVSEGYIASIFRVEE
jgi:hypothetical protein